MPSHGDAQAYHMRSPVLLAQPVLSRVLTYFLTALFVIALGFAHFTQYSRSENARGEIAAASGFSAVVAEQNGIVSQVLVRSGSRVAKGQPLAILSLPQTIAGEGDTTAFSIRRMSEGMANVDQQLAENESAVGAARRQIDQIGQNAHVSLTSATTRRSLSESRQALAEQRLGNLEKLAARGFITQSTLDEFRAATMRLHQEAADADLTISEIRRGRDERIAELETRIRDLRQNALTLRTQQLQTAKQMHELKALQSLTIVAPEAGIVSSVSVRPGERVDAGQRIFAVAQPAAELTVVLEVPSKAIGLIEPGQRVSLKYNAFPYQTFGIRYGRVTRVEAASIESGKPTEPDQKELERRFLVEVRPEDQTITAYGKRRPLRVGMTLVAEIEVERRSLLEWWISPLVTLKGRMA